MQFLENKESKFELAAMLAKLTPEKAVNGTQLSVISAVHGNDMLPKLVYILLESARKAMMIEDSEAQQDCLINAAVRIANECWEMKLEEITLCLYNARKGKYGKSYHKLSEEEIFSWILKYREEQIDMFENTHLDKKAELQTGQRLNEATPFDGVFKQLAHLREHVKENDDEIRRLKKENHQLKSGE